MEKKLTIFLLLSSLNTFFWHDVRAALHDHQQCLKEEKSAPKFQLGLYPAMVTWRRLHESGPIMRWRGHARLQRGRSLSPFSAALLDMTKVQILRWALSRFRMEGYPCYCLIEISVSSKKPRPLNSFQGKDSHLLAARPSVFFFFSLVGVSTSDQCGKLNAYYRCIFTI